MVLIELFKKEQNKFDHQQCKVKSNDGRKSFDINWFETIYIIN